MLKQSVRYVSNVRRSLGASKAQSRDKRTTIDRYLPQDPPKKEKEWEKRGVSKDEFFTKKYSFMSDWGKQKLEHKISREQRFKSHKREHARMQRDDDRDHRDSRTQRSDNYRDSRPQRSDSYRDSRSQTSNDYRGSRYDDFEKHSILDNALLEYVYGRHAVLSVLKAKKRQSYEKLVYTEGKTPITDILSMCKKYGVQTELAASKQQLDFLTNKAVHNGVALATRKLELPTLAKLGPHDAETGTYNLDIWNELYNAQTTIHKQVQRSSEESRNPLALYLDEITDPQNVGAIIRSAYFFGVDFIVTPSHNTARLGPAAAKAAAGALDLMDIYQVENGLKFIRDVKESPWALVTTEVKESTKTITHSQLSDILVDAPVLLVLGSEGSGVRTNIKNLSDFYVRLSKNRTDSDAVVDSLNVSSAASVLISSFMR
ncbi:tRNA G18 (ribose-2'-O)-methylase SpoU [Yamadazyma tenuis]|nr:tRNA G18 (ribose-2'-O)-methylase SpoU [Yamadazyma tenuis]